VVHPRGSPCHPGLAVAGCSSGSDHRDALPPATDAYGTDSFFLSPSDARDGGPIDTRDALPGPVDVYGVTVDSPNLPPDAVDGATADTRDALPPTVDVYGVNDLPLREDTADAFSPAVDGSPVDSSPVDADNKG
jgi:hypothetical protein